MMINYKNLQDIETSYYKPARSKKLDKPLSDTIYVFDIETTSLFDIEGEYKTFDYSRPAEYYQGRDKVAVSYIWQFGVEDDVYFGREFKDFEKVLQKISSPDCYKVIWCHNLSFEQVFLMNIFDGKYTIENMVARSIKAPIEFTVKELNIIFRCSYMLTNLSLDAAAKEYTSIRKRSGQDFNYNVARSPKTKLSKLEMEYCEFDIRTVTEIIRYFKERYDGHLYNIPLTSTSIVRTELKKRLDIWYIKNQQKLVPNRYIYMMLWQAFSGGFTHANILHSGKPLINRHTGEFLPSEGEDEASEYPTKMCTEQFPCGSFIRCKYDHYLDKHKRAAYAFLFKIEFRGVKSNYYTHFMQASKCLEYSSWCKKDSKARVVIDNGRIVSCDKCTLILTDVDFEILKKNYSFKKIVVLECYKSKKDFLDVRIIKFIQELYKNKTTLKGVEGKEVIYKRDKSMLNSLY